MVVRQRGFQSEQELEAVARDDAEHGPPASVRHFSKTAAATLELVHGRSEPRARIKVKHLYSPSVVAFHATLASHLSNSPPLPNDCRTHAPPSNAAPPHAYQSPFARYTQARHTTEPSESTRPYRACPVAWEMQTEPTLGQEVARSWRHAGLL